jgi:xylobiose transport system substrate-binding protein
MGVSRRAFLSAAASVPLLSACGTSGPGQAKGGGKSLQVWVIQDDAQNPIQTAAIEDFNKASASKLKLVPFANSGSSGYTDKLRVGMGSPQAPDVVFNWGSGSIADYVKRGQLVDLSAQLAADPAWKKAFLPSVLDAGRIDGRFYGIPLRGMQPLLLFYNKTLFAEHGMRPPATYDDLLALVDHFRSRDIQPFALGASDQWPNLMWLEYLVDRLGGPTVFQNILAGKPGAWRDPAVRRALDMVKDLVDRGAFGTNFASVNYVNDGAGLLFASRKAAMHLQGTWEYTNQLDRHAKFARSDLGFAPFPAVPGGKGDPDALVGNPTNYFSVNARSADRTAAVSFLRKEMNSPAFVDALIKAGDVPAVTGIEAKLATAPNPRFAQYVYQAVQKAPTFTLSWDQALPNQFKDPLLTSLQKLFVGQTSPDRFISTLDAVR